MTIRFDGKVAIVTGGAQGLGEGMARALAAAGASVVIADVQDDLGPKVAESLDNNGGFVHLDVTDDANAHWPSGRRQLELGVLHLTSISEDSETTEQGLFFE